MKVFFRSAGLFVLAASLLCAVSLAAEAEQPVVRPPEIQMNITSDEDLSGVTAQDITAELSGAPLQVDAFEPLEQGVFYIYMLDVSGSMPGDFLQEAKSAIGDVYDGLRAQDKLALVACGTEAVTVLSGGETAEAAHQALDGLTNDGDTMFYTSVSQVLDLAAGAQGMRVDAVLISDGMDTSESGITREELADKIRSSGVRLDSLCAPSQYADEAGVEAFRALTESSGGTFSEVAADEAGQALRARALRLQGAHTLTLTALTAMTGGTETLTADFGGLDTLSAQVQTESWTPDAIAPEVVSVHYDSSVNCITVELSEAVTGADRESAYTLQTDDGEPIGVLRVRGSGDTAYEIYPAAPMPVKKNVTLTITGVKDLAGNALAETTETVWEGGASGGQTGGTGTGALSLPILAGGAAVVLIVAAALLLLLRKKKTSSGESGGAPAEKSRKEKKRDRTEKTNSSALFVFHEQDGGKKS